jgi:hypothetical protein
MINMQTLLFSQLSICATGAAETKDHFLATSSAAQSLDSARGDYLLDLGGVDDDDLGTAAAPCFGNSRRVRLPIVDTNRYERHLAREQSGPRAAASLPPGACLAA